ncbi:putative ubiquitin-conjugating enzyme E2 26 [Vitis vinifera]|uniref:Putative ubiquitin-conjugating enzyme E2 26 n=1 Tax=Vitis vinifera TaxID=29760 RepID=A0A438GI91_VITVI|nr:putative ubiquitin-conjugating enzyme E2 26 [Vitis vinifera]
MHHVREHFEDFVLGHFCKHAHDILVACKAYMDGAQVGCLVKGGVQDVDEGDKSCSKRFKDNLAVFNNLLVKAFTNIGATGCEKFLTKEPEKPPPPERLNRRAGKSLKGVIIAS